MQLSKTQLKVLEELNKSSNNKLYFMPYMGRYNTSAYWFIESNYQHVRHSTVCKLLEKGLLEQNHIGESYNNIEAIISEEGKKYLERLNNVKNK